MNKKKVNLFDILNICVMVCFCILILFPFWDMIVRSLSSPTDSTKLELMLWPKNFVTSAYRYCLKEDGILRAYGVTIARTVLGTALSLLLILLAGYPLGKKDLPGRNYITFFFLVPMFFTGGLIPSYIINRSIGLVDNFLVYILPGAVNVYNVVLARNFLMGIDKSLEESAFMDGAGYGTVLLRIIVPLSKPILATLALWIAVGHWNAWFDSMIYIRSGNLEVVQLLLHRMLDTTQSMSEEMQMYMVNNPADTVTSVSVRMAMTIITIIPIMCIYPFVQKFFVKGIMVGSLKG